MNELTNQATSEGNYNNIPTSISSNTLIVNMIEGLTFTKKANKENWVTDNLTYTLTLKNDTNLPYESPVITDILDTSSINFVAESVAVDGLKKDTYTYDSDSGKLTINLETLQANTEVVVTFDVAKK